MCCHFLILCPALPLQGAFLRCTAAPVAGVAQTDIFPKSDKANKLGAGVLAAGAVAVGQSPGGGAQSVLKVATDSSLTGLWSVLL